MAGVNKVILIGNLGRDPELNQTQGGQSVCRLSLATKRTFKNKAEETVEETEWHRITVWGRSAENCAKYLSKGSGAYVEGRLKTSSYEQDGIKKYSTEVIAETVQFLAGKGGGGNSSGSAPQDKPDAGGDDHVPF
jgi:single-strand DNA-binding protein